VVLMVDVPEQAAYASYAVDLYDPRGKLAWTQNFAATAGEAEDGSLSVMIPGEGLRQGSYVLAVSGIGAKGSQGQRTEIERQVFDIHLSDSKDSPTRK
jgi:hypothetical protein